MISPSSTTLVQLQSQSKLLGQLLSSRLLNVCVHDFDLTAINNIGRERKRARRKKLCPVEVSQLFLSETVVMELTLQGENSHYYCKVQVVL